METTWITRMNTETKAIELLEAIELLRKAGWTVEPPAKRRTTRTGKRLGRPPKNAKRIGRPPTNGRRKPGRPRKEETA